MNQSNSQKVYTNKTVPPVPYSKYKSKPKSKYRRRQRTRSSPTVTATDSTSFLKSLSSINLVSILNSFYTIRMTVKDLRVSLEKLDNAMDSAYQMFEIAQGVLKSQKSNKRRPPLQLLPPTGNKTSRQRNSSGSYNPPAQKKSGDAENPLTGLLDNVDIGQMMTLMQSPFVQSLLKQFFQGDPSDNGKSRKHAKEG